MVTSLTDGNCRNCGGSTGSSVEDHEADPDPHPSYLSTAEADTLYEPVGDPATALAAHVAAGDPHVGYLTEVAAAATYATLGGAATAGALAAHVAAADPHPLYLLEADAATTYAAIGDGATLEQVEDRTGWAFYSDTSRTVGSPLALAATTDTDLPNDDSVGSIVEIPTGITEWWDHTTGKFVGVVEGDMLGLQIEFVFAPSSASSWIDVWLDDGPNELCRRTIALPKGATAQFVKADMAARVTSDWETNGATPRVRAGHTGNLYTIRFTVYRLHAARTT